MLIQNYTDDKVIEKNEFLHYPSRKYTSEGVSLNIHFQVTFIKSNSLISNQRRMAVRHGLYIYAMKTIDNDFSLSDTRVIQGTYFEETIFIEDIEIKRLHIREKMEDEFKTLKFISYWS